MSLSVSRKMVSRSPGPGEDPRPRWAVLGHSVLGAAHKRRGLPSQDALTWLPEGGTGLPVMLAVADGHGSAKCFRSALGSSLAVEVAREVAQEFFLAPGAESDPERAREIIERQVPAELGRRWTAHVRAHIEANPVTREEWAVLEQKEGAQSRRIVEANLLHAYGSTLLMVVVAESFIAYFQLGDGDLLTISEDGISARPIPEDPRQFGGIETASLSQWEKRTSEFHVYLQPLGENPPVLILAFTDGYANSYPAVGDPVAHFGIDLWKLIGAHGLERVRGNLDKWLIDTTERGSGDDITLGLICRLEAFPPAQQVS